MYMRYATRFPPVMSQRFSACVELTKIWSKLDSEFEVIWKLVLRSPAIFRARTFTIRGLAKVQIS